MTWLCRIFGHKYVAAEGLGLIGGVRCARCGHRPMRIPPYGR